MTKFIQTAVTEKQVQEGQVGEAGIGGCVHDVSCF
jgi:hypothetical protein